ncbi:hypothetical protein E1171_15020 [Cytophagales bacterium RKSG123]|nr:hypothetical protein [Xanthovirga aplysinae]
MHKTVPEANFLNPALFPDYKAFYTFPGVYTSIQTTFGLNDIISFTENGYYLDENKVSNLLNRKKNLRFSQQFDVPVFNLGARVGKGFFTVSANTKAQTDISLSSDVPSWIFWGSEGNQNNGVLDFKGSKLKMIGYHEIAVGYGREINDRITFGARIKYLQGIAHASVNLDAALYMNIDSVTLENRNIEVRVGGIKHLIDVDEESFSNSQIITDRIEQKDFGFNKNRGFAIDLGMTYKLMPDLTLSAAVNDLGFISWKSNTGIYSLTGSNFTTYGPELNGLDDLDGVGDFFDNLVDSLDNHYNIESSVNQTYTSGLTANVYLGANYQLGRVHSVATLFHNRIGNGRISPSWSVAYNLQLGKYLNTVINWSASNGRANNLGTGLSLNLFGLQAYIISDQVLTPLISGIGSLNKMDVRFGLNIAVGYLNPFKFIYN